MNVAIGIFAFLVIIALASAFGWAADSREGPDWAPSDNGRRTRGRIR